MATSFVVTVKSSGGDATHLNTALSSVGTVDLGAAATKVFGISSYTGTPTGTVTGQTSGATATLVLVNAAQTQALFKSISGTFQNGETVQSSGGNSFALTNAGDSAILDVVCFA